MAKDKLFPPQISNKLPAFCGNSITIPFNLTRAISRTDFTKVSILIKNVQSNTIRVDGVQSEEIWLDSETQQYLVRFDLEALGFQPLIGQYYKVQIALVSEEKTGYYSTVGVIKYTSEPSVTIKGRDNTTLAHTYTYTGVYSQKNENDDSTEKVYSYCFNLYNENNEVIATSGELIHNYSNDNDFNETTDTWNVHTNLDANVRYYIEYNITTINGLKKSSGKYIIMETETSSPNVHAKLSAINDFDNGYIKISLLGDKSGILVNGHFILMRSSSEDNFGSWYELSRFDLTRWNTNTNMVICKDYTAKQGFKYRYAIRAYNISTGLLSNRLENKEGIIQSDFEDAFLYDGEKCLKIRFNPKVSSFKSTILESKSDTIGGKYPFIFRNGQVNYKEFPISGLISLYGNNEEEFPLNLSYDEPQDLGHHLTVDNIWREREFKMQVLSWLTNGKPKLFKSPSEGNYIIRLMNTSLTPLDQLGRMLHNFSSTAYEIADYTFENLKRYGFALNDYIETRTVKIVQKNLSGYGKNQRISIPSAITASVVANPGVEFKYQLNNSSEITVTIGSTGTYVLPTNTLKATPLTNITLLSDSWGNGASITYTYYETAVDDFSLIYDIKITDKVVQKIGRGVNVNLIDDTFIDYRLKTGAFHYIKIQPRDISKIYKVNGRYYWNANMSPVTSLNKNYIYYIQEGFEEGSKIEKYIDGSEGLEVEKDISSIDYNFKMSGMSEGQVIDFNGQSNTTGRYEALTNISNLDVLSSGSGNIIDIVYQQKELIYTVEIPGSLHYKSAVKNAKDEWQTALSNNSSQEQINILYQEYLKLLEDAVEELKEEYKVESAL